MVLCTEKSEKDGIEKKRPTSGRPRKHESLMRRSAISGIRVTDKEKKIVDDLAYDMRISVATLVRIALFNYIQHRTKKKK